MCLHRGNVVLCSFVVHLLDLVCSSIHGVAHYEDWVYTVHRPPNINPITLALRLVVFMIEVISLLGAQLLNKGLHRNNGSCLKIYLGLQPLCIMTGRTLIVLMIYGFQDWRGLHEKKLKNPWIRFPFPFYTTNPLTMFYTLVEWFVVRDIKNEIEMSKSKLATLLQYNSNNFIDKPITFSNGDIQYDKENCLGNGQFGKIFEAKVRNDENVFSAVALKQIAIKSNEEYVQVMSSEIKIMIYAGNYKHVVKLVGVCSDEFLKGHFCFLLEFCANGSLDKFLRTHSYTLVNKNAKSNYENFNGPDISEADLYRFSHEICLGMKYLASRGIVHGDLAARNVLLDQNLVVKISDFGLSVHLYRYMTYVKCVEYEEKPLPWRWMATESLEDLQFSEKSDVWSFGVTLWEIFTLGEIPYKNFNWNPIIFSLLLSGEMTLRHPEYATTELGQVIKSCIHQCPTQRPNFSQLVISMQQVINSFENSHSHFPNCDARRSRCEVELVEHQFNIVKKSSVDNKYEGRLSVF